MKGICYDEDINNDRCLLTLLVGQSFALGLEDFEDVSDWIVEVGDGAIDGSITTDAGQAQEGLSAGALNYEVSTATGWDFVFYTLEFSSPIDMSAPNLRLDMDINMPNDPHTLVQIRIYESIYDPNAIPPTTNKFVQLDLGEGDGLWHSVSFDYHAWTDYGSGPDLSAIKAIEVRVIGDISSTASSETIYIDRMELNQVDLLTLAIIDDFEDVSDWIVSKGGWALDGWIDVDAAEAQVGDYAGALHYDHSTGTGNDYVNFDKNISLDLSSANSINFHMKAPNDPDMFIVMRFYDSIYRFLEYNFAEGDGQWHQLSLAVPGAFVDYGNPPDLTDIILVRIHTNGDGSSVQTDGVVYIDQMEVSYSCQGFSHDINGDWAVNLTDFLDFAYEWQQDGRNAP